MATDHEATGVFVDDDFCRRVWFDGRFEDAAVYDGARLRASQKVVGPAIVEETFTTIVVDPGQQAALDAHGNYHLTVGAAAR